MCTGCENSGPETPGHSPKISEEVKAQPGCKAKQSVLRVLTTQQRTVPEEHSGSTQPE